MAKIILILSILAMGGATFFAINNRKSLIELKKETIEINNQIDREWAQSKDVVTDINKLGTNLEAQAEAQAELTASIGARKREVSRLETAISDVDSEIQQTQSKVDALQRELDSIGVDPDTLLDQKEALEKAIVVAGEEAEAHKGEIDLTRNLIATNRTAVQAIQKRLADRKQAIAAGRLTVRVRDVNDEFGFVVLNAGKNSGVTASSQFLVLRGGTRIAKVGASSVEASTTIANVVPGSIAEGAVIMPGDTAILDSK